MIELDESEHQYSDLTDLTLQFIADMYGPEVRDMLLYPVVEPIVEYNRSAI
ncbi:hypothetical protein [Paenibacillus sinensis]|uniref:hypothetical protein n=1 Tax=Paenibacillus sinensis TaxID=2834413 RepID=UPI001CA9E2CA|nr:hypothetical protein [Paenibacillus sinensis]